jgi:hypothetical protein
MKFPLLISHIRVRLSEESLNPRGQICGLRKPPTQLLGQALAKLPLHRKRYVASPQQSVQFNQSTLALSGYLPLAQYEVGDYLSHEPQRSDKSRKERRSRPECWDMGLWHDRPP